MVWVDKTVYQQDSSPAGASLLHRHPAAWGAGQGSGWLSMQGRVGAGYISVSGIWKTGDSATRQSATDPAFSLSV